jgi:hypothetical protein
LPSESEFPSGGLSHTGIGQTRAVTTCLLPCGVSGGDDIKPEMPEQRSLCAGPRLDGLR